ncbi:hypothetical protein [Candidatus Palauibacter sp.]|uniref:hypothetical protein n=1 Tax=Candidatus Palauibacter sp. TaxID=3101350 RepID=UPI003B010868
MSRTRTFGGEEDFGQVGQILELTGSDLLVLDMLMPPYVKVLSRQSGRVIEQFGPAGQGPTELDGPTTVSHSVRQPGAVEVYDVSNRRLSLFDPDRGFLRSIPFRPDPLPIRVAVYGDTYLASSWQFRDFTAMVADSTGRVVDRLATQVPFTAEDTNGYPGLAVLLNESYTTVVGSKVAVAWVQKTWVDLIDLGAGTYTHIKGPRPSEAAFEIRDARLYVDQDNAGAFLGVAASEDLVLVLYSDLSMQEQLDRVEAGDDHAPRFVLVFDWRGRYLTEFELPQGTATLQVSRDNRWLWTEYLAPHPQVAEWALPPIMDRLSRLDRGEDPRELTLCPE